MSSLEKMFEIWSDNESYHYKIGPDRDGFDLIEINYYEEGSKLLTRLIFSKEEAVMLVSALKDILNF